MNPDFQKWLEKLDDKLDRQAEAIHNIDKTLAKQKESLREHIRRTGLV